MILENVQDTSLRALPARPLTAQSLVLTMSLTKVMAITMCRSVISTESVLSGSAIMNQCQTSLAQPLTRSHLSRMDFL